MLWPTSFLSFNTYRGIVPVPLMDTARPAGCLCNSNAYIQSRLTATTRATACERLPDFMIIRFYNIRAKRRVAFLLTLSLAICFLADLMIALLF